MQGMETASNRRELLLCPFLTLPSSSTFGPVIVIHRDRAMSRFVCCLCRHFMSLNLLVVQRHMGSCETLNDRDWVPRRFAPHPSSPLIPTGRFGGDDGGQSTWSLKPVVPSPSPSEQATSASAASTQTSALRSLSVDWRSPSSPPHLPSPAVCKSAHTSPSPLHT